MASQACRSGGNLRVRRWLHESEQARQVKRCEAFCERCEAGPHLTFDISRCEMAFARFAAPWRLPSGKQCRGRQSSDSTHARRAGGTYPPASPPCCSFTSCARYMPRSGSLASSARFPTCTASSTSRPRSQAAAAALQATYCSNGALAPYGSLSKRRPMARSGTAQSHVRRGDRQ